jgi:hypothetical protein
MTKYTALALALVVAWPTVGRAAGGPGYQQNSLLIEPVGVAGVTVQREALTLDLRPLTNQRPVPVELDYRLHCDRATDKVDLLFVSGNVPDAGFELRLDGKLLPVSFRPIKEPAKEVPVRWRPPATTPGINSPALPYVATAPSRHHCYALSLAPGEHRLTLRYQATVAPARANSPTFFWQLAYVLAPARAWGGHGGLDVTVYLPPGWDSAADPSLNRDGDTLTGAFDDLPDDALTLTVRYPPPAAKKPLDFAPALATLGGGLALCVLGGAAVGLWLGGRQSSSLLALPFAAGLGLLSAVGLMVVLYFTFAPHLESSAIPPLQCVKDDRAEVQLAWVQLILLCVLSSAALPLGLGLAQFAAWLTRRLTARPQSVAPVVVVPIPDG